MTDRVCLMTHKLGIRQSLVAKYVAKDMPPADFQFTHGVNIVNDGVGRSQQPSFGIPSPLNKTLLNAFDYNPGFNDPKGISKIWRENYTQKWALAISPRYATGAVSNGMYMPDNVTTKYKNIQYMNQSPRGPNLEIFMNYLQKLNTYHGYGLPKFKIVNLNGELEEFDPIGLDNFSNPITVGDLPRFKLYGHNWYYGIYIKQVQDWLDLLGKYLGCPGGAMMFSWMPGFGGAPNNPINYAGQYVPERKPYGSCPDPNMRLDSWTPLNPNDIGKYGKLQQNTHHRIFPNAMGIAGFPAAIAVTGTQRGAPIMVYDTYIDSGGIKRSEGPCFDSKELAPVALPNQNSIPPLIRSIADPPLWREDGGYYYYTVDPFGASSSNTIKMHMPNLTIINPPQQVTKVYPSSFGPTNIGSFGVGNQQTVSYGYSVDFSYQVFATQGMHHGDPPIPLQIGEQTIGTGVSTQQGLDSYIVYLFYLGGKTFTKRYGIKSSDPKCLFTFHVDYNTGFYNPPSPIFPAPRELTPANQLMGAFPFKTVKVSIGTLNGIGGLLSPDGVSYPPQPPYVNNPAPLPPFLYYELDNLPINYNNSKYPYLPSQAAILDKVVADVEGGNNSLVLEKDLADMPDTSYMYGANFNDLNGYYSSYAGQTVTTRKNYNEVMNMSPFFEQEGDYAYVCISKHGPYDKCLTDVDINTTYEFLDQYRALNAGRTSNWDPAPFYINSNAFAWNTGRTTSHGSGLGSAIDGTNLTTYLNAEIAAGRWPAGPTMNLGYAGSVNHYPLPMHVDGQVYK